MAGSWFCTLKPFIFSFIVENTYAMENICRWLYLMQLSIMTLGIMALTIMQFRILTLSIIALSLITLTITPFNI